MGIQKKKTTYYGSFGVSKIYPDTILVKVDEHSSDYASTVNLIIPLEEAVKIAEAIHKAEKENYPKIALKVDLRAEKMIKKKNLFAGTITGAP